jgi:hypothetical protein
MTSIKRVLGGVDDTTNELARLREQIEQTKRDLEIEAGRPVPLGEIEARVEATVSGLRAQAERLVLAGELARAEGGSLVGMLGAAQVSPMTVAAVVAPGPLAAWLREQALAAAARMGEPIDAETRAQRLAELRGRLDRRERDEAELMWSADERGLSLPWRPDMSPAAVLGLDAA